MSDFGLQAASDDGGYLRGLHRGSASGGSEAATTRLLEIADRACLHLTHLRDIQVLHSGDDHFEHLFRAIANARREICIEMYQVRADPIGWRLCAALATAASRGIEVRLLFDRFGSSAIKGWLATLEGHHVQVRWYGPWRPWNNPFRRTHRKLIVIDGAKASIGGINMGSEFSELLSDENSWRDISLWFAGPAAWTMRRQFEAAWQAHGGTSSGPLSVPDGSGSLCAFSNPKTNGANQADAYRALIGTARREVLLATPYFLPDAALRSAMQDAARRGVRVRVVVPRRNDIWWFKHGSRRFYRHLLEAGVEIWERCDRMVHAKVGVADGLVAAVGSTNLNRLSFYGNSETLLLTTDPYVVTEIDSMLRGESLASAERLSPRSWPLHPDRRPWAELAASTIAMIL